MEVISEESDSEFQEHSPDCEHFNLTVSKFDDTSFWSSSGSTSTRWSENESNSGIKISKCFHATTNLSLYYLSIRNLPLQFTETDLKSLAPDIQNIMLKKSKNKTQAIVDFSNKKILEKNFAKLKYDQSIKVKMLPKDTKCLILTGFNQIPSKKQLKEMFQLEFEIKYFSKYLLIIFTDKEKALIAFKNFQQNVIGNSNAFAQFQISYNMNF